ncbi:nucleolar protein dao-5 isoform X2 [Drosophila montana]|uniref:nucleolar protein dao-5 isoform X2 n=1 Tax=Drosophila montana TaxID=40370 RepID=UPI00313D242F
MADQKKGAESPSPKVPEREVLENAATSYGLEDHEATAQDPRVNELKNSRSTHLRRSLTPSTKMGPTSKPVSRSPSFTRHTGPREEPKAKEAPAAEQSEPEIKNAARNYGLEDHKTNLQDSRVANMHNPRPKTPVNQSRDQLTPILQSTSKTSEPVPAKPVKEGPHPVTSFSPSAAASTSASRTAPAPAAPPAAAAPPVATVPPTPSAATAAPVPPPAAKEKMKSASKFTNTDVTFDPSKEFASKTTNTAGNLYTDDEGAAPAPAPPAPIPVKEEKPAFDLDECYVFAVALVRKAGAIALESNKERLSFTTKDHEKDLNTRADTEIEEMLTKSILEKYPEHKVIAEEAVSQTESRQVTLTDAPTWIIDPIDGTMNFVHHFPYYCISVALMVDKQTAFGIVFNPPLQEFYTARKGKGAQLNNEPMQTSGQESLKSAMILQEYSSGMHESRTSASMENAKRLIGKTHALRSIGSSAMGLAMVASGVADGFYFFGLHVWDMAAGNLLVTEAGGTVIDPAGGEVDIMSRRVLAAATEPLAKALSSELVQNYPKPRDDEKRTESEPLKKDFTAQTEFSDTSLSLDSDSSTYNKIR